MTGLHTLTHRSGKLALGLMIAALVFAYALVHANTCQVTVIIDGRAISVTTARTSVAGVLDQIGFVPRASDKIVPGLTESVAEGSRIVIETAFNVSVKVGDSIQQAQTPGGTVQAVLDQLEIPVFPLDRVTPDLDALVQPNDVIEIVRVDKEFVTEKVSIPFGVRRWAEPKLEKGKTAVLREGREGVKELVYEVVSENGREVSRALVSEKVIQEPKDKIIGIGTKIVVRTLMTAQGPIRYTEVKDMVATAYYPGPESTGTYADGFTATGMRAGHGVVAVDPKVIPLGTKLFIPGYGTAIAADVGGAIKGNRIDLCFDTYREAIHFGRKQLKVYILQQ